MVLIFVGDAGVEYWARPRGKLTERQGSAGNSSPLWHPTHHHTLHLIPCLELQDNTVPLSYSLFLVLKNGITVCWSKNVAVASHNRKK